MAWRFQALPDFRSNDLGLLGHDLGSHEASTAPLRGSVCTRSASTALCGVHVLVELSFDAIDDHRGHILRPSPQPPQPTLSRSQLDEVQQNRRQQQSGPEINRRVDRPAAGFEYFARMGVEPASGQLRDAAQ